MCYMTRPSLRFRFYHPKNIGWAVQIIKLFINSFLHPSVTASLLSSNILLSTLFSNTLSLHTSLNVSDRVPHSYQTGKNFYIIW
jgi:hypothetical protein